MATYGRGRHILPSVHSVLAQDMPDLELLVVGDHCTDDTAQVVAGVADARVRWINLPERWRSQSGPNNAGIAAARGRYIAYLGHDDVWERFHLSDLAGAFDARPQVDFAVGGAILHFPPGVGGGMVTGMFEDDSDKHRHFFPPSSFAHRTSVPDRIGNWHHPETIARPVDHDVLLRAAKADLGFASTGRISVHKFTAAQRYLSYLCPSSDEQARMLANLSAADHPARMRQIVAGAQANGDLMCLRYPEEAPVLAGALFLDSQVRRGVLLPDTLPLQDAVQIVQVPGTCAMDWRENPVNGIRWSLRNPQPRFLLNYTATTPAVMRLHTFHTDPDALQRLDLSCNGRKLECTAIPVLTGGKLAQVVFRAQVTLRADAPSVLEFRLDAGQAPAPGRRGIGIGDIRLWLRKAKPIGRA